MFNIEINTDATGSLSGRPRQSPVSGSATAFALKILFI